MLFVPPFTPPGDQARGPAQTHDENPVYSNSVTYKLMYEVTLLSRHGFKGLECSRAGAVIKDGSAAENGMVTKIVTVDETGE
jgi:hypothetical protein